ncbi:MAG: hypothetical protein IK076_06140 [Bacteroidales bacterium]|nr:hypothetical protein [Bacteroidales bacterium]
MKRILSVLPVILILLGASCSRVVESRYDSIGLVDALVADSLPSLQRMAREAGKSSGTIVLLGDPVHCLSLSEEMIGFDGFDNVDAREVKDGLPDFSGETIVSILDFANFPYDSLSKSEEGRLTLREIAVRNALAALDSTIRCKVLLLCSPELAEKGGDDVADFFEKIGCEVPVIYSMDSTFSHSAACYKILRERNLFTHNIAWPAARLFMTVPDPIDPFSIVDFDDSRIPESFADTVGILAPNTFVSYVQNKH